MSDELHRVTYVEDEPDIRTIAEISLTQIGGFTLQLCENGNEAVDKVPAFSPDLILLDVMMPGIDGVETYKKLRTMPETEKTPIIFMTAKVQSHESARYREIGAIGVIAKPFDPITLPDEVRSIWLNSQEGQSS